MGQSDPDSFTDDVRRDFVTGCVEMTEEDAASGQITLDDPESFCECAADALDEDVEFDDLKDANSDLRKEPGPLPEELEAAFAHCRPET